MSGEVCCRLRGVPSSDSTLRKEDETATSNASANGSSAGPATVDVSSATNEVVFDTVSCETCTSLNVGDSQTERWNLSQAALYAMGAGSTESGVATVTMSWALGSADYWAIIAVPIKPP